MSTAYSRERSVAIAAVLKACIASGKVFGNLTKDETVTKGDKSPVTLADYTAQALISTLIFSHFPNYGLVGEEDSKDLKSEGQKALRNRIVELANEVLAEPSLSKKDDVEWQRVGTRPRSETDWLEAIDKGDAKTAAHGLTWALDPIDGTKGFLRGGQYAVCLALIKDGEPVVGVIGCPNLAVDFESPDEKGVIFVAVRGQGAYQRSFTSITEKRIHMAKVNSVSDATFCESVEAGHSDQKTNARIASILGITKESVRMDSQAKYCSISRGDGHIYLRMPVTDTYEEKIWDHAAGCLLVAEAGGTVSNVQGKPINFGQGRTLKTNKGVVASSSSIHSTVVEAVKKVLAM